MSNARLGGEPNERGDLNGNDSPNPLVVLGPFLVSSVL